MRVSGFHEILRGLWALSFKVLQGSTKFCKDSTRVPQGSTMFHKGFQKCSARFRGLSWREAVCRAPVV